MVRLRNVGSGAVVNVDDATAKTLPGKWESADEKPKSPAPRRRKKSDDDE